MGSIERVRYIGSEEWQTRGDYGDPLEIGYTWDKAVYIHDSTFGWDLWSLLDDDWVVEGKPNPATVQSLNDFLNKEI